MSNNTTKVKAQLENHMYKFKFFFFFIFFAAISSNHLESVCLDNNTLKSHELIFEEVDPAIREYLINFAIESNDIYQTRIASIDIAREVFDISDSVFKRGVIETLKLNGEIVGFYTLKVHFPSEDWFEHELGHLFVKAGLQSHGYGTLLFKRAVAIARSKGWEKLEWLSDPDAEIFYLKMGATITDHCENLLNPDVDLPVFKYNL